MIRFSGRIRGWTFGGLAVVVAVVASISAVWLGGSHEPPQAPDEAGVAAAFDETTGGIEGTVVHQEDQTPLAGAQVGILFIEGARAATNEEGRFALSFLPPDTYQVLVQRVGFLSHEERVDVTAGQKTDLVVGLVPDPAFVQQVPYAAFPQSQRGHIGCAYGAGGGYGTVAFGKDWCGAVTAAGTNEAPSSVAFGKDPGQNLTGFLVSVQWQSNTAASSASQLALNLPVTGQDFLRECRDCVPVGDNRVQGTNGFVAYYDSLDPRQWLVHPEETLLRYAGVVANGNLSADPNAWASEKDTWGGLMVEQDFEIAVYLLYNGKVPPAEWNLWGEA